MFMVIAFFAGAAAGIVLTWNRFFAPVPWRLAILFWCGCALYQAGTLFTSKVDVPGNLAFVAYPWQATGRPAVKANTGIIFTQIAPWTRVARDAIRAGEVPLWNRFSASGAPLLANQQTAAFHPFTLLGLPLPLGKAFTLSACLRLFVVLFFTFILLRGWNVGTGASVFGATAYTLCSFHVIWLLFPLGLATMMLPACLVGVQELVRAPRPAAYALLVISLSCSVLGGHPESSIWVWIITVAFAVYDGLTIDSQLLTRIFRILAVASCFIVAMLLTAFFWYPTLSVLRQTTRFQAMQLREFNPVDHGLSYEWLLPMVTPNILGTPVNGTYTAPRGSHPSVLNDYGEVASGYAGLITLACALAAPFVTRRKPLGFALGLMIFALLTMAEAPWWRELLRALPMAGISLHQRLRIVWDLGVCLAGALALDELQRGGSARAMKIALGATAVATIAIYAIRQPSFLSGSRLAMAQASVPMLTAVAFLGTLQRRNHVSTVASTLVLADLLMTTYGYNPPARPADLYPVTGAIAMLQRQQRPFRFAAWGYSFLPDTPAFYAIEDVKTTDPIQNPQYMLLLRAYLAVDPASSELVIRDTSQPFFDFLNVRYLYVPPGQTISDTKFIERYRGTDGVVLENTRALPRYFLVQRFTIEPRFETAFWQSRQIRDYRVAAIVDRVPESVLHVAPFLNQATKQTGGGDVSVERYTNNTTVLDVTSNGWNLLASSDVHWPGWRAYWNGKRQPTVVVNGAFLGCFVPPGRGRITFQYQPPEHDAGLRATGLGSINFLAILTVWCARIWRDRKDSP